MGTKKGNPKSHWTDVIDINLKTQNSSLAFRFASCFITLPKSNPRNSNFKA
jgi:hypothetical protein